MGTAASQRADLAVVAVAVVPAVEGAWPRRLVAEASPAADSVWAEEVVLGPAASEVVVPAAVLAGTVLAGAVLAGEVLADAEALVAEQVPVDAAADKLEAAVPAQAVERVAAVVQVTRVAVAKQVVVVLAPGDRVLVAAQAAVAAAVVLGRAAPEAEPELEGQAEALPVAAVASVRAVPAADVEADKMRKQIPSPRAGFTLLELMLSLTLIVVATALIGSLMQMYARNFASRGEDIRRMQLARAVLNMIAEDIRSVVIEQEYDGTVLEQQLGGGSGGGGSGGGGQAAGGASGGGGLGSGPSLASEQAPADNTAASTEGDLTETIVNRPPGIYGDQYTLIVDVSRLPRPDEYMVQQTSLLDGSLTDIPGDIKTVTYFVQAPTNQGVADDMAGFGTTADNSGLVGGLVRRALDRGVTAYAEEMGNVTQLSRTGDLVAPEIVAIEFAYFDSELAQWVYEWDSSVQSLPWLIQISLVIQSATASEQGQLQPGTPLSSMTIADRQALGVEVYELVVAIPGANLVAADAVSADAAAGMDNMGL